MDCLVLSPSYLPINQVSWDRAISYLFRGLVEVLEVYEDWTVRSPGRIWQVPAVIRFLKGAMDGKRKAIRFSRENVYLRDKGRCQYCGITVTREAMTLEHVVPRAQGGHTRWENVATACFDCNQRKRNRTPAQAGMRLRVTPVKPAYLPDTQQFTVTKARAAKWSAYLRDMVYWTGELESD